MKFEAENARAPAAVVGEAMIVSIFCLKMKEFNRKITTLINAKVRVTGAS